MSWMTESGYEKGYLAALCEVRKFVDSWITEGKGQYAKGFYKMKDHILSRIDAMISKETR